MKYVFVLLLVILLAPFAYAQQTIEIDLAKDTTYVSKLSSGEFLFSYTFTASSNTDFKLKVSLPENSVIIDRGGLLISRPVFISTDGKRIFLEWSKSLSAG